MKYFEGIFAAIFVAAAVMKLFHVPVSGPLLTLSGMGLLLFYTVFSFALFNDVSFTGIFKKESYTGITAAPIIVSVISGFSITPAVAAIIFLFQKWPGIVPMAFGGIMGLITTLILLLIMYFTSRKTVYLNILARALAIAVMLTVGAVYIFNEDGLL